MVLETEVPAARFCTGHDPPWDENKAAAPATGWELPAVASRVHVERRLFRIRSQSALAAVWGLDMRFAETVSLTGGPVKMRGIVQCHPKEALCSKSVCSSRP